METLTAQTFSFADFELDGARRLLLKKGQAVLLNSKTFDLLFVLVENHGQIVHKDELLEKVWAGQFVEENNLTVHISALRKVFGEKKGENSFIVTVPGKGYKFVADIHTPEDEKELIIENHSFSRIVIEEENGFSNETISNSKTDSFEKRAELSQAKRPPFSRLTLALGLTAMLLIGGASAWIYKSRNQTGGNLKANALTGSPQLKTRIFTTSGGVPHRVAIAPDGKSLAYVQRYKGQDSIWLGDLETNNSIQINAASDRLHLSLSFAPDGKSLYFIARDDNHLIWTLMRVSIFGGATRDLITGVHSAISFSPDGKQLAFLRSDAQTDQTSLVVADAETGKDERILLQPEKPQRITSHGVSWSPDGNLIVVGASDEQGKSCEIMAVDVARGTINKIGDKACRGNSNLVWLPDGSGIVLTASGVNRNENGQIWLVSYPSGEVRQITNDTLNYGDYSLSVSADNRIAVLETRTVPKIWLAENDGAENARQILEGARVRSEGGLGLDIAPDGKILFVVRTGDSRAVWEMNPDGTNQRQLTASQKDSDDVQISATADNRFLVFESNRSGKSEIWRANRDGSNLIQLTNGGGNSEPTLSPDGLQVTYTATRDRKSTLWRVSVEGGEPSQITNEETSWADVSPDGKHIACAFGKAVDAPDKRIAVIPFEGGRPVKIFNTAKHGFTSNRLRWSPDGKAIIYKDSVQGLWQHDLDKEKPEAMEGFDDIRVSHFAFSLDGKLVFSGGISMREIVILENFAKQ